MLLTADLELPSQLNTLGKYSNSSGSSCPRDCGRREDGVPSWKQHSWPLLLGLLAPSYETACSPSCRCPSCTLACPACRRGGRTENGEIAELLYHDQGPHLTPVSLLQRKRRSRARGTLHSAQACKLMPLSSLHLREVGQPVLLYPMVTLNVSFPVISKNSVLGQFAATGWNPLGIW